MAEVAQKADLAHEVRDLKRDTLKRVREVMRNLARLRQLTGAVELVALGEFVSAVGMQQASAVTDARLVQAVESGAKVRQKLTEAEGGTISAENAAKELGMSKVAVLKRYQNGQLVAWREERQNAVRFPVWQFKEGKVLDGLEAVLSKLNAGSRLDDFGRMLFFLSNSRLLGRKRPLDCLRVGEVHKVLQAAEIYGG